MKNATTFILSSDVEFDNDDFTNLEFTGLGAYQQQGYGWDRWDTGEFVKTLAGKAFMLVRFDQKVIPKSSVDEQVRIKVALLKATEKRTISKKEIRTIKDDVIQSMLPSAYSKTTRVIVFFDKTSKLLVMGTTSIRKAEDILALLMDTVGDFINQSLLSLDGIGNHMTRWVYGESVPERLELLDKVTMTDVEGAKVTITGQDIMQQEEVIEHLSLGKMVTSLKLSHDSEIIFNLNDIGQLRSIKPEDYIKDEMDGTQDGDLILLSGAIVRTINNLQKICSSDENFDLDA